MACGIKLIMHHLWMGLSVGTVTTCGSVSNRLSKTPQNQTYYEPLVDPKGLKFAISKKIAFAVSLWMGK